jgi:thiosulfate dehydrogenase (quinone) large subunit
MTATVEQMDERLSADGRTRGMWAWTVLRILIGWSFLWAFLDKMFGLGFSTCRGAGGEGVAASSIDYLCDAAMINGGSPTYGFLNFGTQASHTGFLFDWMAPSAPDSINLADVGFMSALLLLGVALMLGVATRIAALGGAVLMLFMFLAADVWPENNPVNSSHVVEMVVLLGIATVGPGRFSLQNWMVRTFPFMSWAK